MARSSGSRPIGIAAQQIVPGVRYFRILTSEPVDDSDDANGNPTQWIYQCIEAEKTSPGYGGWDLRPSEAGYSGKLYNFMEDLNDGDGVQGNGIDHDGTDYLGTGFSMSSIPGGMVLVGILISAPDPDGAGSPMFEAWVSWVNGEDGACS